MNHSRHSLTLPSSGLIVEALANPTDVSPLRECSPVRRSRGCVAVGMGFEPTRSCEPYGLSVRRLRPLGHPTAETIVARGYDSYAGAAV